MDVLLAEDDACVREALADTLADAGLVVAAAASAEEALRVADAEPAPPPSVLVTDVDLTTAEGNQAVVAAALDRFGRLDAACFVTGVIITGRFLDNTAEQCSITPQPTWLR